MTAVRSTPRAASAASELGVEMQRRRRRGDRARPLGEHGLVALDVLAVVGAVDVGRQRHVAVALEQFQRLGRKAQAKERGVAAGAAEHLGVEGVGEADDAAGLRRLARAHLRDHDAVGLDALDQRLDRAAARLDAEQARLDHRRVVDDEQVAGAQQLGQIAKAPVVRRRGAAVEQARGAALGRGMLGDQLARQREVEIARNRSRGLAQGRLAASKGANMAEANSPMAPPARRESKASAGSAAASVPEQALAKLGLVRDIDLALHLPLRYEDETRVVPIASLHDGETGQVEGVVTDSRIQFRPRRQLVVKIADDSGDLVLRFLHFYPSQQKTLAVGRRVRARGEARGGFFGLEMVHPAFKVVTPETPLPTALTPVYPSTVQLSQAVLRKAVAAGRARADLDEHLPEGIVPAGLPTLRQALDHLHEPAPGLEAPPPSRTASHPAWQRLKFEELLAQQLSQLLAKRERERQRAPALAAVRGRLHDRLLATLPFKLTRAQRRVAAEIDADLARAVPMHRLLQGDVGSGKTVVAALAAARAIDAGWQCALMAPTEILAEQHLKKLVGWLAPLGVTVAWLTGSRKGKARDEMLAQVASGEAGLVVGTHAVIEEQVRFARLGLAIIDEQHRFGVAQRLALAREAARNLPPRGGPGRGGPDEGRAAHLLMMSATPIPRTLAMTLFADLDVSTIDELPPGRTPVVTKLFADSRRDEVIARIRDEAARGRQTYWVCPLVDESAALDLKNATATHAELCEALPGG